MSILLNTPARALIRSVLLLACASSLFCHPHAALAGTCTATTSTVNFGSLNFSSSVPIKQSQAVTVSCTGWVLSLATTVRACVMIGTGTAPASSGISSRALGLGGTSTNTLPYSLYSDSGYSQNWGYTGTSVVSLDVPLTLVSGFGQGSSTALLYPDLPALPATAPAGTYSQNFGSDQTALAYQGYLLVAPACGAGGFTTAAFSFQVLATVTNFCQVTATDINFGSSVGILSSALTANGTIQATCTSGGGNYSIALDKGIGGSLTDRQMSHSSTSVHYQLYTDASHTTPWGDGTSGTSVQSGTATGTSLAFTVYGQVQAQTTPAPNTYSDTITVTVTY